MRVDKAKNYLRGHIKLSHFGVAGRCGERSY